MLGRLGAWEGGTRTWTWTTQHSECWWPALSFSRAFLEYYQEHLEYACPTEDIYLE